MVRIATSRLSGHPGARVASPARPHAGMRRMSGINQRPDYPGRWFTEARNTIFACSSPIKTPRSVARAREFLAHTRAGQAHTVALGQVVLIQFAAAVDSLWVVPGFGQPSGAVMLRIGMVMIRSGSQLANSYFRRFLLIPATGALDASRPAPKYI